MAPVTQHHIARQIRPRANRVSRPPRDVGCILLGSWVAVVVRRSRVELRRAGPAVQQQINFTRDNEQRRPVGIVFWQAPDSTRAHGISSDHWRRKVSPAPTSRMLQGHPVTSCVSPSSGRAAQFGPQK